MTNVRLCTGAYAKTPYFLNSACTNVYCMEEMCYLFALNPFMITKEIMNNTLIDWIEDECQLEELATELRKLLNKGSQLSDFTDLILSYVNYCDEDEVSFIDDTLKTNSGLNDLERKKHQADYLLKNGKYEAAIEEYESLISALPNVDSNMKPSAYHNVGFAYAKLFVFDIAAKYFKRAYEMSKKEESAVQYLAAMRMNLSDDKYINFISNNSEYHDASLLLEKKVKKVLNDFEGSEEYRMLNALSVYKDEGNVSSYYEEIDKVIDGMKEDYLKQVID